MSWRGAALNATYALIFVLFFCTTLLGWHLLPNSIWGIYSLGDGALAAWTASSILAWSKPFDLSPYNIFQGLGSLYIPHTPWLNPGALALSLPFQRPVVYYLSYSVYLIEAVGSLVFLCRALGFPFWQSAVASQLFWLVVFPPFTHRFLSLPWMSLAPVYAHLFAVCNLGLALFAILGRRPGRLNIGVALAMALLVISGLYSSPLSIVIFLPLYGLFAAVIAVDRPTRESLCWKLGTLGVLAATAVILRVPDFYFGTIQVSARELGTRPLEVSWNIEAALARLAGAWNSLDWCGDPYTFLCWRYPIAYFHAAVLAGAAVAIIFHSGLVRRLGVAMLLFVAGTHLHLVASHAGLSGPFAHLNVDYLLFSGYALYALFWGLLLRAPVDLLCALATRAGRARGMSKHGLVPTPSTRGRWLRAVWPTSRPRAWNALGRLLLRPHIYAVLALGIIPFYAVHILLFLDRPAVRRIVRTRSVPAAKVYQPAPNPITETLRQEVGLRPGGAFRGFAATYFGAPGGPLRRKLEVEERTPFSPEIYIESRFYMEARYGTRFMFTDLWDLSVPTFEEYGQWITKPLFVYAREMFGGPGDRFGPSFVNVYRLHRQALRAIGVRFIITDSALTHRWLRLRAWHTADPGAPPLRPEVAGHIRAGQRILGGEAVPVLLYEVVDTNLGSFSPTRIRRARTAREILSKMQEPGFSPEDDVVLQESVVADLVRARGGGMKVNVGSIRLVAFSEGTSILLLPLQFSRCLSLSGGAGSGRSRPPRLLRANLVQAAVVFERQLDADLSFDFGIGSNSKCRLQDVSDYEVLDFSPWQGGRLYGPAGLDG